MARNKREYKLQNLQHGNRLGKVVRLALVFNIILADLKFFELIKIVRQVTAEYRRESSRVILRSVRDSRKLVSSLMMTPPYVMSRDM